MRVEGSLREGCRAPRPLGAGAVARTRPLVLSGSCIQQELHLANYSGTIASKRAVVGVRMDAPRLGSVVPSLRMDFD